MTHRLLIAAAAAAGLAFHCQADVEIVDHASLATTHVDDFNDLGLGQFNVDGVLERTGLAVAERFVGQTLSAVGDFDVIDGAPAGALALAAGAPGENLSVFDAPEPWLVTVIAGNGPVGYPDFDAIGEGAVAILFESDQVEFGIELEGADFGCATFDFYRRDGSKINSVSVCAADNKPYGFRESEGDAEIAGVVITNMDSWGLGYDNIRFNLHGVCDADANGDGVLNILDFVAFQAAFAAGDPGADCNGDEVLNVLDFVCFQSLFAAGCA